LSISSAPIRHTLAATDRQEPLMRTEHRVIPGAADPRMSMVERTLVLHWLEESHDEFFAAIDGVSQTRWTWKPSPTRWSVGDTAEHIVAAEAVLFNFVQRAIAAPPNSAWEEQTKGKTQLIIDVIPSRQGKARAPEPIVPRLQLTREQVKERFDAQRAAIVTFAAETQLALKAHTIEHPFPILGTLNGYQWLVLTPLHTIRHNKQIAEVKTTLGYPSEVQGP
jgi:hypothetical protein